MLDIHWQVIVCIRVRVKGTLAIWVSLQTGKLGFVGEDDICQTMLYNDKI